MEEYIRRIWSRLHRLYRVGGILAIILLGIVAASLWGHYWSYYLGTKTDFDNLLVFYLAVTGLALHLLFVVVFCAYWIAVKIEQRWQRFGAMRRYEGVLELATSATFQFGPDSYWHGIIEEYPLPMGCERCGAQMYARYFEHHGTLYPLPLGKSAWPICMRCSTTQQQVGTNDTTPATPSAA